MPPHIEVKLSGRGGSKSPGPIEEVQSGDTGPADDLHKGLIRTFPHSANASSCVSSSVRYNLQQLRPVIGDFQSMRLRKEPIRADVPVMLDRSVDPGKYK